MGMLAHIPPSICMFEPLNMQTPPFPHLHVDLFKAPDEVSDLAKSKTTHSGRSPYAHQENPFLVVVLELLVHKVYLE